jgi:hypothetical protein
MENMMNPINDLQTYSSLAIRIIAKLLKQINKYKLTYV